MGLWLRVRPPLLGISETILKHGCHFEAKWMSKDEGDAPTLGRLEVFSGAVPEVARLLVAEDQGGGESRGRRCVFAGLLEAPLGVSSTGGGGGPKSLPSAGAAQGSGGRS